MVSSAIDVVSERETVVVQAFIENIRWDSVSRRAWVHESLRSCSFSLPEVIVAERIVFCGNPVVWAVSVSSSYAAVERGRV